LPKLQRASHYIALLPKRRQVC